MSIYHRYILFSFVCLFSLLLFPSRASAARCTFSIQGNEKCALYEMYEGNINLDKSRENIQAVWGAEPRSNSPEGMCKEVCDGTGITGCLYEQNIDYCGRDPEVPSGYAGPIPDCAFTERGCRNVDDLIELAVNIGRYLFSIMGSVAFIMFIYGGITMVISFGNAERFKKGQGILVAAVIGIIISLSAYLLIGFLLQMLNVQAEFRIL